MLEEISLLTAASRSDTPLRIAELARQCPTCPCSCPVRRQRSIVTRKKRKCHFMSHVMMSVTDHDDVLFGHWSAQWIASQSLQLRKHFTLRVSLQ